MLHNLHKTLEKVGLSLGKVKKGTVLVLLSDCTLENICHHGSFFAICGSCTEVKSEGCLFLMRHEPSSESSFPCEARSIHNWQADGAQ